MLSLSPDTTPHKWWLVNKAFTDRQAKKIEKMFPEETSPNKSGQRALGNEFRKFIKRDTPEGKVFADFNKDAFKHHMTDVTGVDMLQGKLRIELCADGPGFWLEQHVDIPEKLMTLQVYIGSGNSVWGTTIYSQPDVVYKNLPFINNTGWLSVLGEPVLHGVMKNKVDGYRKSVIINYVTDWKDTEQLY